MCIRDRSQLKTIYKDAADTITGNCDCTLFLSGKEKSTLKEISEVLGAEQSGHMMTVGYDCLLYTSYVQRDVFDNVRASLRVSRCQAEILECQHSCSSLFF